MLFTIVVFVLVLGILVFVHELGHFLVAKKAGLRVEEFGFGFPPRIVGFKKGDTIYSLNWLPFGGFVRIHGEDGQDEKNPKSFANRKPGIRALILGAGILMNLLLAIVFFSIALGVGYPQAVSDNGIAGVDNSQLHVSIADVDPGSPAETAGLSTLDEILKIQGVTVRTAADVKKEIEASKGASTSIVVLRDGKEQTLLVTPRAHPEKNQGALGVELVTTALVRYPWYQALWFGFLTTFDTLWQIILSLYGLIHDAFVTGSFNGAAVTGPIGIASLSGKIARHGIVYILWFMAFLSVNLAFMNALPIPALDGGRLLFVVIEKFRGGKKIKQETENLIHTIGFLILLLLIIAVTVKDIVHFQAGFVRLWDSLRSWF